MEFVSALIGNVLLTGAAQQVYSSCDICRYLYSKCSSCSEPSGSPAQASHGRPAVRRDDNEPCLSWQTLPSRPNFCCLCRKSSGGGSGGAVVILGAGWTFSTSPPFQETHFVVSSLRVCKRREGVEAKGHGGGERRGGGGSRGPNDRPTCKQLDGDVWRFKRSSGASSKIHRKVFLFSHQPSPSGLRLLKAVITECLI